MKRPARPISDHPLWLALIPPAHLVSFAYGNWLNSTQCITNSAFDYLGKAFGLANKIEYLDYWEARTICIDPYWVNQWLKNYSAGIVKRGLLGTGLGTLSPGEINIILLNIACFLIPIFIFLLMALAIRRQTQKSWPLISVFLAILALTPFGKVLAETTGDPLQVVCLITLTGLTILADESSRLNETFASFILAIIYLISILIYEGSFLLLLPILTLTKGRISRIITLTSIGVGAALIWQFSGAESNETGSLISSSYSGFNPITGNSIRYIHSQNLAASASFFFNVKQEFSKYIDDPYGSIRWIGTAAVMSLFFMLIIANFIYNRQSNAQYYFIKNWLAISLFGLPFFLITHDWFRYGIITIILAVAMLARQAIDQPQDLQYRKFLTGKSINVVVVFLIVIVAALIGPHQLDVRRGIVPIVYWQAYGGMAVIAGVTLWRSLAVNSAALKQSEPD